MRKHLRQAEACALHRACMAVRLARKEAHKEDLMKLIAAACVALSAVAWAGWTPANAQAKLCDKPRQMEGFKTCANVEKAEAEGAFVLYSTDPEQGQVKLLGAFNKMFPKIKTS